MVQDTHSVQWTIVGNISLGITIPWVIYKVMQALMLQRTYKKLVGKVVVITGASSGLGEALAHEFYKRGCQVVLCARRRQELERVRNDLLHRHSTAPVYVPMIMPLDLSDTNALPTHIEQILAVIGRIDILVNNAGISHRGRAIDTKPDIDKEIMSVNYFGTVAITKAVLPSMISRKSGHIVQVSSIQGLIGLPGRSAYCASKHALQAFSDSLRAEVVEHNINVTIVSPGYIKTQLSVNALTGEGNAHGVMDKNTAEGYTPEFVAEVIVRAVVQKKKEAVISPFLPRLAILLRKYIPDLYFYVMARRAKNA